MKKVLLATSALVASAGIAAADVEITGFAEMGILDDGAETQFHTDIDATFKMSGETDSGLTFGATIDLDEEGGFSNTNGGPEAVFISGGFGTLTMGDTDGAYDAALQEIGIGGSIADDHTAHGGYNGNSGLDGTYDGQVARYDYSFGDLSVHLSAEIDDTGAGDPVVGLGVKYATSFGAVDLGLGLGYQTVDTGVIDGDLLAVSVDANFSGGFRAILNYAVGDVAGAPADPEYVGIGIGYTSGPLTATVNYGSYDDWILKADPDSSGFGLAVDYDLGGGAEMQFGYGNTDDTVGGLNDGDTWSFGLAMSF
jgi:outer membrane protein OmpU